MYKCIYLGVNEADNGNLTVLRLHFAHRPKAKTIDALSADDSSEKEWFQDH